MNDQARSVLAAHRGRLAKASHQASLLAHKAKSAGAVISILALAGLALSGCSLTGTTSAGHGCSDKVVQSLTTNTRVNGLWNCLSRTFQDNLKSYYTAGLVNSVDDAVFTDPNFGKPAVIGVHYVGHANGTDIYAVVVQSKSKGIETLVLVIWVQPDGHVDNLGFGSPNF